MATKIMEAESSLERLVAWKERAVIVIAYNLIATLSSWKGGQRILVVQGRDEIKKRKCEVRGRMKSH